MESVPIGHPLPEIDFDKGLRADGTGIDAHRLTSPSNLPPTPLALSQRIPPRKMIITNNLPTKKAVSI
jgi:hypothetical protein